MKRRWVHLVGMAGVIALAVGVAALVSAPEEEATTVAPARELLALGQQVYAGECAACHGADLEGARDWRQRNPDGTLPPPPHDDSGHTWHHPDAYLFAYTKYGGQAVMDRMGIAGRSAMPAFGARLSDAEIAAVLAYIRAQWSPKARLYQQRLNQ